MIAEADRKIAENLCKIARDLDAVLAETAGKQMGFNLIVFNSEPGSKMNYISNCARKDVVPVMRDMLERWEQKGKQPKEIDK